MFLHRQCQAQRQEKGAYAKLCGNLKISMGVSQEQNIRRKS